VIANAGPFFTNTTASFLFAGFVAVHHRDS